MMVAPLDVPSQGCADRRSPITAESTEMRMDHQNMALADPARLRAAAAGTMSSAVTSSTPTAHTEKMTMTASMAEKRYCQKATCTPWALAITGLRAMR